MSGLTIPYEVGAVADEVKDGEGVRDWNPAAVLRRELDWKYFYDVIFSSNLLLDNIYQAEGLSEDRINYHRGQALFTKGLSYFFLSRYFGKAIVTSDSKTLVAYPLSSMIEVIDASIVAGEEGFKVLPLHSELRTLSGSPVPNKQFGSKGSCAALLAHAYA